MTFTLSFPCDVGGGMDLSGSARTATPPCFSLLLLTCLSHTGGIILLEHGTETSHCERHLQLDFVSPPLCGPHMACPTGSSISAHFCCSEFHYFPAGSRVGCCVFARTDNAVMDTLRLSVLLHWWGFLSRQALFPWFLSFGGQGFM